MLRVAGVVDTGLRAGGSAHAPVPRSPQKPVADAVVAALKAPLSESPVVRRSDSLALETGVNLAQFEDWTQQLAGLAETVAGAIDES